MPSKHEKSRSQMSRYWEEVQGDPQVTAATRRQWGYPPANQSAQTDRQTEPQFPK